MHSSLSSEYAADACVASYNRILVLSSDVTDIPLHNAWPVKFTLDITKQTNFVNFYLILTVTQATKRPKSWQILNYGTIIATRTAWKVTTTGKCQLGLG